LNEQFGKSRDEKDIHIAKLIEQLDSSRKDQQTLSSQIEGLKQSNQLLEERLRQAQADFAQAQGRWTKEIDTTTKTLTQRETELTTATRQLQQSQAALTSAQQQQAVMESNLKSRSDELATMQSRIDNLESELSSASMEMATLKQSHSGLEAQLAEKSEQLKKREDELVITQENIRTIERVQASSQTETDQLKNSMQVKEAELNRLRQTLAQDQQSLRQALQDYSESQILKNQLDEQLRIAKENQASLQEDVKALKLQVARLQDNTASAQADRDRYKNGIDDRETKIGQMQAELDSARRELASVQSQLKQVQMDSQEREQQLIVDREGSKWQLDRLQRELDRSQGAYQKLSEDYNKLMAKAGEMVGKTEYEASQQELSDAKTEMNKLNATIVSKEQALENLRYEITQRERELREGQDALARQAQAVLQASSIVTPSSSQDSQVLEPRTPSEIEASAVAPGTQAKVYRMNKDQGFMVLSLDQMASPRAGDTLVLYSNDEPTFEVQLGDVDSSKMAVAYIKKVINPKSQVQKGDFVIAQQFINPKQD
jgi:putative ABC transport system permease protein